MRIPEQIFLSDRRHEIIREIQVQEFMNHEVKDRDCERGARVIRTTKVAHLTPSIFEDVAELREAGLAA